MHRLAAYIIASAIIIWAFTKDPVIAVLAGVVIGGFVYSIDVVFLRGGK